MKAKILLLGDFCPVNSISSISPKLNLDQYDIILMNLETPVNKDYKKRLKAGPHLSCDERLLTGFFTQNMIVNIANNHIMDYGKEGLDKTIETCNNSHIDFVGAGENINVALNPIIKIINGIRIGIIGCTDTQFGIATPDRPGVAPIIHGKTEKIITQLSSDVDICIISVHGASEMSPWPSPDWQDMLRGFIDAGADIVHGHHSHVPQGYEKYNNGFIFYGLGNFIVDPNAWKDRDNTLWSIAPSLEFSDKKIKKVDIQTIVVEETQQNNKIKNEINVRFTNDAEQELNKQYLINANIPLENRHLLNSLWQEISLRLFYQYYSKWLNVEFIYPSKSQKKRDSLESILVKSKRYLKSIKKENNPLLLYHIFACENHNKAITTALGVISGELDDTRNEETKKIVDSMMPWSKTVS